MDRLRLHDFHEDRHARFVEVNGMEVVAHYGNPLIEHAALLESAGVMDLSFRGRLCLTGADRQSFLNGQVTNNVKNLKEGEGCYAALVTAKAKMQSDLNIYALANEILLDFEPGIAAAVAQRLEKYIIADDVQVVDASPHYGLLSVQGPKSASVLEAASDGLRVPARSMAVTHLNHPVWGELYLVNQPRWGNPGVDVYAPTNSLVLIAEKLIQEAAAVGGRACGWEALETARIEAGIPRFGLDMDETNLAPEAGIEGRAISYNKGCYIGQEVIARIKTYGQVAKALRGLRLSDELKDLPKKGDKLYRGDKEIGYVTSSLASPALKSNIALAYVRREANQIGTGLVLRTASGDSPATIVELPFRAG